MFTGLSSLRAQEKKPKAENTQLQEYLKKYTTPAAADEPPKKKRKKVKAAKPHAVNIVDADLTGFERTVPAPLSDEEPEEPGGCSSTSSRHACRFAAASCRCLLLFSFALYSNQQTCFIWLLC
jgi:hypothetical protein